jgi:hypothetical protein
VIRRAAGIFLNVLTVASLLLCLAAVGAWGRSYWRTDRFTVLVGDRRMFVETDGQRINGCWTSRPYFDPMWRAEPAGNAGSWHEFFHRRTGGWLGFRVVPTYHQTSRDPASDVWFTEVGVPFYFVFWTAALLPAARARRALRRRARSPGLCPACGYDCRATPERCPECGRVLCVHVLPDRHPTAKTSREM